MKTKILLSLLAAFLLCSCAHQPVDQYAYNTVTGSIDTVKTTSPILYVIAGLASGVGNANFSPGSINVSPGTLSGLGNCSAGAK